MKSKPEYRHIFTSPSMFYRALHTISSQKYRLPVRRYIFDLFNIELDADVVRKLSECAISLRIPHATADSVGPSPVVEQPQVQIPSPGHNASQAHAQAQAQAERERQSLERQVLERAKQRETVFRPRPVRQNVSSESEDEESDGEEKEVAKKKPRAPVMSLRPKSRIIGFN